MTAEQFANAVSDVIVKAQEEGVSLGDMVTELDGIIDGLKEELAGEEE